MSMKNYKRRSQLKHIKNTFKNLNKKVVNQLRHWGMVNKPEVEINPKPRLPEKV